MQVRPATGSDLAAITRIYNESVLGSTASFDLEPRTLEDRARWLAGRTPKHPVLIAEIDGEVAGWGALSTYSDRAAYAATAELSVYIAEAYHRRGVGRALATDLLDIASREGLHVVIARICAENTRSAELMRSLGFAEAGTMHEVGNKFGRWLDVVTWEYLVQAQDR